MSPQMPPVMPPCIPQCKPPCRWDSRTYWRDNVRARGSFRVRVITTDHGYNASYAPLEKLWIWDNVAMSKVSRDFFIHDFPPSFVSKELQSIQTKYLKKWSGLAVRANPSVLYRPREDSGIGLKEVAIEHTKQRLIRRHQLATSRDPQVREIHGRFAAFQHRKKTNTLRHQWLGVCGDG